MKEGEIGKEEGVKKYWNWLVSGPWAGLKILGVSIFLTAVLFQKFIFAMLFLVMVFFGREMLLMYSDPEYDGSDELKFITGDE